MKLLTAMTLTIALGACAGAGTAISRYGSVQPMAFAHDGATYRVYDKPSEGRMMITPSLADSRDWNKRSSMFGPELEFADAAQAFVQGRGCHVTNAQELIEPQFEVTYSC